MRRMWGSTPPWGGGIGLIAAVALVAVAVPGEASGEDGDRHVATSADGETVSEVIFEEKWGSRGSGNGQFDNASGIAADAAGNVYVADQDNHRIQVFDSQGNFIRKWGSYGNGVGQFGFPEDVAVDSAGNVFVADDARGPVLGQDWIQVFDSRGNLIRTLGSSGSGNGQFDFPLGVALGPSGNVFVADTFNYRIQVLDSQGNFLRKWGTKGNGNGQFDSPVAVALDDPGNVFVADNQNTRIQVFDPQGNFLRKWGSPGSGNGQFSGPGGPDRVAIDSSGNVYVSDSGNNRIQAFDAQGNFIRKWGAEGGANGQFSDPTGVAVDDSGNVYVSDTDNSRIQKFSIVSLPRPEEGTNAGLVPIKGTVLVRPPGESEFRQLTEGELLPIGTEVDTTKGTVRLITEYNAKLQRADFYAGVFKIRQPSSKKPIVTLKLSGKLRCGSKSRATAAKKKKKKKGRRVWGKGKGKYKTKGKRGVGSVRGTKWLTEDRCNRSTRFKVKKGKLVVDDFTKPGKRNAVLRKGGSYTAG